MQYDNNAIRIRREILIRVAQAFFDKELVGSIDRIPVDMRPKKMTPSRCCIHKDRAVIKYRCMATLGMSIEDEEDELKSLSEYAKDALEREKIKGPILTVIDEACSACVQSCYEVTSACRGCLARPCMMNCPKNAINIVDGRARIDPDKCIKCGLCVKVCPYHAIVRIPIPCEEACPVNAISKGEDGKEQIDYSKCIFCGKCMMACPFAAIMEKSQIIDVLKAIARGKKVVAMPAPAVVGQFPGDIRQIAGALKEVGFAATAEVALGADITTEKESAEFIERMGEGHKLMTTSCCPAYVEAAEKHVPEIKECISSTRTPMSYIAEWVKERDPDYVTVFIGPCVAKRKEALSDAGVDYVLTFEELGALFVARGVDVAECEPEDLMGTGMREGRGFPISGGVAQAVETLVGDKAEVKPALIDGLDAKSIKLLKIYAKGKCPGNMLEVMGCEGGCVSGPAVLGNPKKAAAMIANFAKESPALETKK